MNLSDEEKHQKIENQIDTLFLYSHIREVASYNTNLDQLNKLYLFGHKWENHVISCSTFFVNLIYSMITLLFDYSNNCKLSHDVEQVMLYANWSIN